MVEKELPSTPRIGASPLVKAQLPIRERCESPGRYPGSAQAHRVSPTERNLLSTGPVDNGLFRSAQAAYGFPQLTCRSVTRAYVSVHVTSVPNTYSIGAEAGCPAGSGAASSGCVRSKGECCRGDAALQRRSASTVRPYAAAGHGGRAVRARRHADEQGRDSRRRRGAARG